MNRTANCPSSKQWRRRGGDDPARLCQARHDRGSGKRTCGQSLRQLQRRFQSAFGITPQEFLLKTRVLAAQRLLESTSRNASEIAKLCGFVDASSFAQHFRQRIGMTPTEYRERMG
jgi:AraC-like DNA-binding protein